MFNSFSDIKEQKFTFIDLFAGIGGFHIAMHNLGGKCVFASEMDVHARKTYETNFKPIEPELFDKGLFNDDIRNIDPVTIPDFDVLCAGFPCQPFSQAGHKRGFDDNHKSERGNLFFNIVEIIEAKQPKAFFLENVRGLISHDNGNTFKVIRHYLEAVLGYSFYCQVVKASDYGLPQLRPRAFMIGFKNESVLQSFTFPEPIPLKYTMSDVWEGKCSRKIGFTLRVGGRGSSITDRRNWDSYLVDGVVKRLEYPQGKRMQGFPEDYEFPVSKTQAIKQLGNSVAIDAIQAVGSQLLTYLSSLQKVNNQSMTTKHNKGEWTELLVFTKLLADKKLQLSDKDLNPNSTILNIDKVTTHNLDLEFLLLDNSMIKAINKQTGAEQLIDISTVITDATIAALVVDIKSGTKTFDLPSFKVIQDTLGFNVVKGGTSKQKADILLDITHSSFKKQNEGFGIKSYLGAKPTLLNASGNTNFVFEVNGLSVAKMDEINSIDTKTKLRDRIFAITGFGGALTYKGAEKSSMDYNLQMVDSSMPAIVGELLLSFYRDRNSKLVDIIDVIHQQGALQQAIGYPDKNSLIHKVKKLLVDILLGFFAGTKWNGQYESNGTIVMKQAGDCVGFHIIELDHLKDYLFSSIKLDTPSSTRHRFGKIYREKNGKMYFKLNLQLRF